MENEGNLTPLSPKVGQEKQEEVVVYEDFDDSEMICEDAEEGDQQQGNGSNPAPSYVDRGNQGRVEVAEQVEVVINGDEILQVPNASPESRVDPEVIDLSSDDDEVLSVSEDEDAAEDTVLLDWDKHEYEFSLWHTSSEFKEMAKPFVDIGRRLGDACYNACRETYNREPTVAEFANFCCVSEDIPDRNWSGDLLVVNCERRGWPLQYTSKGKVFIEGIKETKMENPKVNWKYVVNDNKDDLVEPTGPSVTDLKLWQVDITGIGGGEDVFYKVEKAKKLLATVRKLMHYVWFPSDPESFLTFFNHVLYDRLGLLFYLEDPSLSVGKLSDLDRSRTISAIKYYNHLRNCAFRVRPSQKKVEVETDNAEMEDEDGAESDNPVDPNQVPDHDDMDLEEDELDTVAVKFQMDLKRHTLELSFLLSPMIRPLMPHFPHNYEAELVNPDEVILVMKEATLRSLKDVYAEMEKYGVHEEANIRILPDLEEALKSSVSGTTVFVTSGNYNISSLWKLAEGGSIIGLKTANSDVTISPTDAIGDIWMFIDGSVGGTLTMKNLSIVVDTSMDDQLGTAIYVTQMHLIMENCVIRDNNTGSNHVRIQGVEKSSGATVKFDEACIFTNIAPHLTHNY